MQDLDTDAASIGEQVISSSLWMVAWRWSARLIGLLTTVILARLLFPEDFGVVATAGIVAAFFTMMIDLGTDSYLIRHEAPDSDDYDTAWTLRLVVLSFASAAVFLAAQPGANFFDDQRLVDLVRFLAVVGFLSGFTNIGMTMYRRNLQFREIAIIGIIQRLSATATTLALAFWLRNYWAIVIGESVFALVGLVLSYTWHPYRPRIKFTRIHQQWEFSKWILVRNLGTVLRSQGDGLIIAKFFGVELMGIFSMGAKFAALPTQQLIKPVLAPIFSGLAKKQDDHDVFVASTLKVIGAMAFLTFPAATLFATLDEPLVNLILGERWDAVVPLVAPLTFTMVVAVLSNPFGIALTIEGRVKLLAGLNWFAAIFIVLAMLLVAQWRDLELLVWARLAMSAFMFIITCYYFQAILKVSVIALFSSIYRPALASLVMALVIHSVTIVSNSAWIMIIAGVVLGGVSYILMSGLLWRLAGSPDSGEALLVRKLGKVVAGISNRVIKPKL
jgi:lipopolysaccharide exporter